MTSPADATKLLQDALDTQPAIIGQPNDDNLLRLKEKLLDVLQTISYNRADRCHHVIGVIQTESAYMADHNGTAFPIPKRLGLWDDKIAKDMTVVEIKRPKPSKKLAPKITAFGIRLKLQKAHPHHSGEGVHQQTKGWHHVFPQSICM